MLNSASYGPQLERQLPYKSWLGISGPDSHLTPKKWALQKMEVPLKSQKLACTRVNLLTDIAKDCPGTQLNGGSLEIVENFCYLGDTLEQRGY